jgi:hypothetical protein
MKAAESRFLARALALVTLAWVAFRIFQFTRK